MKEVCRQARANGRRIGLVPTMGALHDGHLSLIRRTKEQADIVVVSIFVNPTQFGDEEDFESYPRDLAGDVDLCIGEGVDYVFAPQVEELYPEGSATFVEVVGLGEPFEGASRPGHFRGVTTVVLKLFEIVKPNVAAFGLKDAQQSILVRRMVRDLMLDVEVLVLPTVRDEDGLALSSRNRRLSGEQRLAARAVPRALDAARQAVIEGQRGSERILAAAREVLEAEPAVALDYLELVDRESLRPLAQLDRAALLLVAVRVGGVRLLDNLPLGRS
jgi:pantoate--beta-alanine ligase